MSICIWRTYLKALQREEGWRKIYPLVHSPDATTARAGLSEVRSQEHLTGFPHGSRGPRNWAILCCFLRCISKELNAKWSIKDTDGHIYEILAPQSEAEPITSWCWPQDRELFIFSIFPSLSPKSNQFHVFHILVTFLCN